MRIFSGSAIRPEIITSLTLDVCERQWVRQVKCEYLKNDLGEKELWISDRLKGQKLLRLSEEYGINHGVSIIDFGDGLYYISRKDIDPDTGKKVSESILYEINLESGYVYRVSHLLLGYNHIDPKSGKSNADIYYNEDPETYANILRYLKNNREESVKDLFVKIENENRPGIHTYYRFLDVADRLIEKCVP